MATIHLTSVAPRGVTCRTLRPTPAETDLRDSKLELRSLQTERSHREYVAREDGKLSELQLRAKYANTDSPVTTLREQIRRVQSACSKEERQLAGLLSAADTAGLLCNAASSQAAALVREEVRLEKEFAMVRKRFDSNRLDGSRAAEETTRELPGMKVELHEEVQMKKELKRQKAEVAGLDKELRFCRREVEKLGRADENQRLELELENVLGEILVLKRDSSYLQQLKEMQTTLLAAETARQGEKSHILAAELGSNKSTIDNCMRAIKYVLPPPAPAQRIYVLFPLNSPLKLTETLTRATFIHHLFLPSFSSFSPTGSWRS